MMATSSRERGRPRVSSREAIEREAIRLFREHGFAATTIPMIAHASGVSRTSVFRYWGSKSEIIWTEFDAHTHRLTQSLQGADRDAATMTAVREQVVANLARSIDASALWMERFAILDSSPDLSGEAAAHWLDWAGVVADHIARRHGLEPLDLVPQTAGAAVQAAFLAVLRRWLPVDNPSADLLPELDAVLRPLCDALQQWMDVQLAASGEV
ncbi:TetR family transcriptional regulator [Streptomyces scopuliridis]|nr:TetR family transcriptional regulator [Streptomyces scopuliridis]